jgi:hypothetical protein
MSFIDDSEKNIKFIKEQTGGSVAGFVGRSGMGIDQLFGGPFHPDSGHGSKNKQLLQKQLKDRREQRKDIESDRDDVLDDYSGLPDPIGGYYAGVEDEGITMAYDELDFLNYTKKSYSDAFTPLADVEWKSNGWDYEFDEVEKYIEEEDFINTSETNMSYVNLDMDYDEVDSSMGRDRRNKMFDKDYIQQSEENIEEKIEEIELKEDDFLNRSKVNLQTIYRNDIGLSIDIGSDII